MPKYIKKPIEVDAFQITEDCEGIPEWLDDAVLREEVKFLFDIPTAKIDTVLINTLEGETTAKVGDWIIKGVKGELYPCRQDIFAETYTEVTSKDRIHDGDEDLEDL